MFARLDTASRRVQVERALLERFAEGRLRAGERLPTELSLAQQFGVSSAAVREAIARLRADGVVSTKPGRGAVLESPVSRALRLDAVDDAASLDHVFKLRQIIEVKAAGLAAQRGSRGDIAAIDAAYADMAAAARQGRHAPEADLAFHRATAAATHNPALVDFIAQQLRFLLPQAWANSARRPARPRPAQAEHRAPLDALRKRDAAAREAARAHLQASHERLKTRR